MFQILFRVDKCLDPLAMSCGGENKIVRELQYFLQCSSVHNITLSQVYIPLHYLAQ